MMKILIVIPCIDTEMSSIIENYGILLSRIQKAGIERYRIVLVYQSAGKELTLAHLGNPNYTEIIYSSVFSSSHARNLGISSLLDEDYIYFLDCRIIPDFRFLETMKILMDRRECIWHGELKWQHGVSIPETKSITESIINTSTFSLIRNACVSTYVFKTNLLTKIRYNETVGLSKTNKLQGGEDVLFLYDLVLMNHIKRMLFLRNCFVFHEPRSSEVHKYLKYSEAQGAVYRHLLERKMPLLFKLNIIYNFVLFTGNTFFRLVLLKKDSLNMLKKRAIGFINNEIAHPI